MAASSGLTGEQRRRIEENRRKALQLRAQKTQQTVVSNTTRAAHTSAFITVNNNVPKQQQSSSFIKSGPQKVEQKTGGFRNFASNQQNQISQKPPASENAVKSSFYSTGKVTQTGSNSGFNKSSFTQSKISVSASSTSSSSTRSLLWQKQSNVTPFQRPSNSNSVDKTTSAFSVDNSPKKGYVMKSLKAVKGACVLVSRERFEVVVTYFEPLVAICKMMNTKSYDPVSKRWSFDLREYESFFSKVRGLDGAVELDPLPRSVLVTFAQRVKGQPNLRHIPEVDLSHVDKALTSTLMPFQKDGVNFGIWRDGRVLIADDMGLGKTIQALCVVAYYRKEWPLLIVVPSSVRFSWAEQIKKWLPSVDPDDIRVAVTGKDNISGLVTIISYDLMVKMLDQLKRRNYQVVIMDESHFLKNNKTARTQAAFPLLKNARRAVLLSGTPALSRPSELFTQLTLVDSKIFPKFHDFGVRYCNGKRMPWGWDFSGSSHLEELQLVLEERIMIRRLKKDVLSQLPAKQRQMVVLDPQSVKINKDLKSSAKIIDKVKGMERRGALLQYFHETASAKITAVKEYVSDLLEADNKFLVFAHHQEVLEALENMVQKKKIKYMRIDGSTNAEQRNFFCSRFQTHEEYKIAILSITAANAGLNLTAAKLVIFAELFWNPGILLQAEDRAHRIGQEDSVNIHYLVARGTADDHIWPMVQNKLDILSKAGLTKDDFSSADTKHIQDPNQQLLLDFFDEETDENNFGSEENEGHKSRSSEKTSSILNYFNTTDSSSMQNAKTETKTLTDTEANSVCTGVVSADQSHCDFADDWFDELDDTWGEIPEEPPDKKARF